MITNMVAQITQKIANIPILLLVDKLIKEGVCISDVDDDDKINMVTSHK